MEDLDLIKIKNKFLSLNQADKQALLMQLQAQVNDKKAVNDVKINSNSLSHAQMRLWILEQLTHCPYLYHIPCVINLAIDTDEILLEKALRKVIADEPVLTSYFLDEEGEVAGCQNTDCHFTLQNISLLHTLPAFLEITSSSVLASFYLDAFCFDQSPVA